MNVLTVHVNEIHTDVTASGTSTPGMAPASDGRSDDERWRDSRGRTEWLALRVRSEGFSD